MAKFACALLVFLLLFGCVSAEEGHYAVERMEGEAYFPSEDNWTYHFTYAYPRLAAEDIAGLMVNDCYQMALDEMLALILPMFANEPAMRFDGKNEITHDFSIPCNNGRFLSVLSRRTQTMGDFTHLTLEAQVFDISGEFAGETLTLRGVTMVGDSSDQIARALMPVLYDQYRALIPDGVAREDIEREEFDALCSPLSDFYANPDGSVTFFLQPELMPTPSFDVPMFTYTVAMLEELIAPKGD